MLASRNVTELPRINPREINTAVGNPSTIVDTKAADSTAVVKENKTLFCFLIISFSVCWYKDKVHISNYQIYFLS